MWRLNLIALVLLLLLSGCGKQSSLPLGVVIRLGDQLIRLEEVEKYLSQNLGELPYGAPSSVLSSLLDSYIEMRILSDKAEEAGIVLGTPSQKARRYLEMVCQSLPEPTEKGLRDYYEKHISDYTMPEAFWFRQILTDSEERCQKAFQALKKGKTIDEVVKTYSQGPNAKQGGKIPPLSLKDIPREMRDDITRLSPGQWTACQAFSHQFMILYLEKKEPSHRFRFSDIRDKLKQLWKEDACEKKKQELLDTYLKEKGLWIIQKNLPFTYSGHYQAFAS